MLMFLMQSVFSFCPLISISSSVSGRRVHVQLRHGVGSLATFSQCSVHGNGGRGRVTSHSNKWAIECCSGRAPGGYIQQWLTLSRLGTITGATGWALGHGIWYEHWNRCTDSTVSPQYVECPVSQWVTVVLHHKVVELLRTTYWKPYSVPPHTL